MLDVLHYNGPPEYRGLPGATLSASYHITA
jgi:hypothetical protein